MRATGPARWCRLDVVADSVRGGTSTGGPPKRLGPRAAVGVKDAVLEVHKGRYAGDGGKARRRTARRAGAAPSADFVAHWAGASRADKRSWSTIALRENIDSG